MFRLESSSQFSLTICEEKSLCELCILLVKAWYTAPIPIAAPSTSMTFNLKSLLAYS